MTSCSIPAGLSDQTYRVLRLLGFGPFHQRRNCLRRGRPHLLADHADPIHHHGRLGEHPGRGRVGEPLSAVHLAEYVLGDGVPCDAADDVLAHLDLLGQLRVADAAARRDQGWELEPVNGV